jgi:hypothetical protein
VAGVARSASPLACWLSISFATCSRTARAGHELTAHGDTYVGVAVPLVIVALGVPVAAVLSRLTRAWSGDDGAGEGRRRWWSLWLTATVL